MKEYVLGFMFALSDPIVALIKKNRPEWQAGRVNGIGGKVEEGEHPDRAIVREFREETGVTTEVNEWRRFGVLEAPDYNVHLYSCRSDRIGQLQSTTDEKVLFYGLEALGGDEVLPNLRWLVPMALSFERGERASRFTVKEEYDDACP